MLRFDSKERDDSRWQLREEILLGEVERDALIKLHELTHLAESAGAQSDDPTVSDHHFKAARKQYHSISKLLYPFGTDDKPIDQHTQDMLIDLWKREFGDPEGPKVRETAKWLNNLGVSNAGS